MATDLSEFKKSNMGILKTSVKKDGRPPKKENEKLNQKVTINFTSAEKEKLLKRSKENRNIPITTIIRNLLIDNDYI
jgi:hypothetical protein